PHRVRVPVAATSALVLARGKLALLPLLLASPVALGGLYGEPQGEECEEHQGADDRNSLCDLAGSHAEGDMIPAVGDVPGNDVVRLDASHDHSPLLRVIVTSMWRASMSLRRTPLRAISSA